MSNSGTRTDTLRRWIGRLPLPGLSELIQWWPLVWPYVVAAAVAASALAVFVMTAIPFAAQTALVAFGAFVGTVWAVHRLRAHWTSVVRFVRRSGFSIKRRALHRNSFRNQVGQRRDLIVWSDLQLRITGASVVGFNYSSKPIFDVKVYARSLKTNQVIEGYLDGMPPEATYGIPGRCEFTAFVNFEASTSDREGLTAEDFRDFIGDFELVVSCDGTEKRVHFPLSSSEAKIQEPTKRRARGLRPLPGSPSAQWRRQPSRNHQNHRRASFLRTRLSASCAPSMRR